MAAVSTSYESFLKATAQSRDLVVACDPLPALQRNLIYELALLRTVIAWEVLVEDVFVAYLLHRPTRSGRILPSRLPKRAVNAGGGKGGITLALANDILKGDRDFVDWFAADPVKKRSKLWFGPRETKFADAYGAFTDPLGRSGVKPFDDIKVIRNRIAHSSGSASLKFAKIRNREVAVVGERRGMGPGQFLRRNHHGPDSSTWFEVYHGLFDAAADVLTT